MTDINNTPLLDEEINAIYDILEKENNEKELLLKAQEMTDSTEYNEIEEITYDEEDVSIDDDNEEDDVESFINTQLSATSRDIIKEALLGSDLNLKDKDADKMIDLILVYRNDKSAEIYKNLPSSVKMYVDITWQGLPKKSRQSKESISKALLSHIIKTSELEQLFTTLDDDVTSIYGSVNSEMSTVIDDTYKEIFDSIDKIREENPDKADEIQAVKDAFDRAKSFDTVLDYLYTCKPRDVRKYSNRYNDTCFRLNTIVNNNVVKIKMPKMDDIYEVLKKWFPKNDKDELKEFCVLIANSVMDLDYTTVKDTAYAYKLLDRIYKYKYIPLIELEYDEECKEMINSILSVISKIQEYKNPNKEVK